jgi:hypothetical protein
LKSTAYEQTTHEIISGGSNNEFRNTVE